MKYSILNKAHDILYNRSKKEIEYGPFIDCMEKTAKLASILSNKKITIEDSYNIMIAIKLSRESYTHKEDNLLDVIAYIASLNDYKNG